jgi:hypothetical protein
MNPPPHENRGAKNAYSNPTASDISGLRAFHNLTVEACAALALSTPAQWRAWEAGERRMHPAIYQWVLAQLAQDGRHAS